MNQGGRSLGLSPEILGQGSGIDFDCDGDTGQQRTDKRL